METEKTTREKISEITKAIDKLSLKEISDYSVREELFLLYRRLKEIMNLFRYDLRKGTYIKHKSAKNGN